MPGKKSVVLSTAILALSVLAWGRFNVQAQTAAADLSVQDQAFVADAAQIYMLRQQFGKLADMNGERDQVKEVARRLAEEARNSYDQLRNMASDHDVPVPTNLDDQRRPVYFRLYNLYGADFDREFVLLQLELADRAVRVFDDEARFGHNPDIRGFAQRQLDSLKRDRQNARDIVRIPV